MKVNEKSENLQCAVFFEQTKTSVIFMQLSSIFDGFKLLIFSGADVGLTFTFLTIGKAQVNSIFSASF